MPVSHRIVSIPIFYIYTIPSMVSCFHRQSAFCCNACMCEPLYWASSKTHDLLCKCSQLHHQIHYSSFIPSAKSNLHTPQHTPTNPVSSCNGITSGHPIRMIWRLVQYLPHTMHGYPNVLAYKLCGHLNILASFPCFVNVDNIYNARRDHTYTNHKTNK